MRKILEVNEIDSSGADDVVVRRCQDLLFYGALEKCPLCSGQLDCIGSTYQCSGTYSEWTTCTYSTRESIRKEQAIRLPDGIQDPMIVDWVKNWKPENCPPRVLLPLDKPFTGIMISLSGRLTKTHQYWKEQIEKHGGKVSNSVIGATCLVVSPAERERGGPSKVAEAMERNIPVVRESWLVDSIAKKEPLPLDAYDVVSDLVVEGNGVPWDKLDPTEEAVESLNADLKLTGKRGVYKDSKLREEGGRIFEKAGLIYNCAFSLCDQGRRQNEYCILQLIVMPENQLHLYYKKGLVGDDARAEERVDEFSNVGDAVNEFTRLFNELTGNEFEPWEREKNFTKRSHKFYPVDMGDGIDVRSGGLALRQLGAAAAHSKLHPLVANFMKVLCSQEIYRYALMEMGHDSPDLPMGMLSDFHLKKCEEELLNFFEKVGAKFEDKELEDAVWLDFSNKWFTLMHSTRPFKIRGPNELANHVAATLESVRDVTVASHLIGDKANAATLDDPLSDCYEKLNCSIAPLDKGSEDYEMIVKYLKKTYVPMKFCDVTYDVSVENIFMVESHAGPSYDDVKKLPNKLLLWCGTRSSNLLRHLHMGFLPATCYIPAPGYMFGKAIVCSDAAAEAAKYGFTAVDRPEGFLVLAIFSQGVEIVEISNVPENVQKLDSKSCIRGLGRMKTDESEHFVWKDDIKVPCGSIVPSSEKDSPLEYNEYAVFDPMQVCIRFLVGVKYEERDVEMVSVDPTEGRAT